MKSSNVLILSPNSVFSDYISHVLPELGEELNINIFKKPIRTCQAIEKAIADSKSLFLTAGDSNGADDYADAAMEILDIIGKGAANECA